MLIEGLKSNRITVSQDLLGAIVASLGSGKAKRSLKEGDILVITSKVVSITQGGEKKITGRAAFEKLVKAEADRVIGGEQVTLTIKDGIFIPWAGVDRSNTPSGTAVVWPKDSFSVAEKLRKQLKKRFKVKKLGVLITDSFCAPLRRGVTAVALGYAGIKGVNDLRGKKDMYGNKLKVSQQAIADMIAVAAHLVMGESTEQTPFAIVSNAPVQFTDKKNDPSEPRMDEKECLYAPLYQ